MQNQKVLSVGESTAFESAINAWPKKIQKSMEKVSKNENTSPGQTAQHLHVVAAAVD